MNEVTYLFLLPNAPSLTLQTNIVSSNVMQAVQLLLAARDQQKSGASNVITSGDKNKDKKLDTIDPIQVSFITCFQVQGASSIYFGKLFSSFHYVCDLEFFRLIYF